MDGVFQIAVRLRNLVAVGYRLSLGGAGAGLLLDGDRHEETGFDRSIARDGCGFGFRGGYAGKGCQGAAAGAVRALGFRLRQRAHERLHLPRHYSVQPQAVGRRLLRAALERDLERAALRRHIGREHRLSQPCGVRDRLLRRHPADLRQARPRFRRLGLHLSGWTVLRFARRHAPG